MAGYVGIQSTYTPVEYIESSGTQWIDTGVNPTQYIKTELKYKMTSGTQGQYAGMMGCQNQDNSQNGVYKLRNYIGNNISFQAGNTAMPSNVVASAGSIYEVSCEFQKFVINSNTYTTTDTWLSINANITLFGLYSVQSSTVIPTGQTSADLYYCKIYDNNVLIRDFIPVVDENNVACLWDKVEEKAYYNQGTGVFTAGSQTGEPTITVEKARNIWRAYVGVQSTYTPVEYIESTGTQCIDTGIVRNITKKYEMKGSFSFSDVQTIQLNGAQGGTYIGVVGGCYQITQGGTSNTGVAAPTNTFVDFDITFDCGNQVWYGTIKNVTINTTSKTFDDIPASAHFHLFSLNGLTLPCSEKIAWWKLYENSTLVRDFIPVVDNNGVACLYDKVEGKPYYNKGTGSFTVGNSTGEPTIVETPKARKIKKGYVGIVDPNTTTSVARKFYSDLPLWVVTALSPVTATSYGGLAGTEDYIVYAGGYTGSTMATTTEYYDTSGVKTTANPLGTKRACVAASKLGQYACFCGGTTATSNWNYSNVCEAFDNNKTRYSMGTLSSSSYGSRAYNTDTKMLVCGGDGSNYMANMYGTALTRTTLTSMSTSRTNHQIGQVNNIFIVAGGRSSNSVYSSVETYTESGTKSSLSNLPSAVTFGMYASTKDYFFIAGGRSSTSGSDTTTVYTFDKNLVRGTATSLSVAIGQASGYDMQKEYAVFPASAINIYNADLVRDTSVMGHDTYSWYAYGVNAASTQNALVFRNQSQTSMLKLR